MFTDVEQGGNGCLVNDTAGRLLPPARRLKGHSRQESVNVLELLFVATDVLGK